MKSYIAFLRGINISGKNRIDMSALKTEFKNAGFINVSTYLNSGNVSFMSDECDLKCEIEKIIHDRFALDISVYVLELDKLNDIVKNAPAWWGLGDKDQYDNLVFILSSDTPEALCEMVGQPSDGMERIQIYKDVIFWTFDRKRYQKCNWWKRTASTGIAEKLTIRTANTIRKVCKIPVR